jgi:hypothetical protein
MSKNMKSTYNIYRHFRAMEHLVNMRFPYFGMYIPEEEISDEEREELHESLKEMERPLNIILDEMEGEKVLENEGIRLYDNKIDKVAKKMSDKMNIPKEKAEAILKIGIFEGLMMNRFRNIDLKGEREEVEGEEEIVGD